MLLPRGIGPGNRRLPWPRDVHRRRPPAARAPRGRRRPGARDPARPRARAHRRHGPAQPGRRTTRPSPTTARRCSGAPGPVPTATSCVATEGADPLADQSTDKFAPLDAELADASPAPLRERLPVRVRHDRPALRPPGRPRSLRDPLRRAQLGGPGRPPRRARLARRRPGPGAVRDRGQGRAQRRARAAQPAASSTSRPRSPTCSACAPHDERHLPRAARTARSRLDVLDLDAGRPQHVSASSSTAPTRTCSTTMAASGEAPNVAAPHRDGHRVSSTARWRACRRSRSRTTRRSSPAASPVTTASSTTRGSTAPRGEQIITNSSATWPWAMKTRRRPAPSRSTPRSRRTWPDEFTASVNEPCDIDAGYSTFDFFRRGEVPPIPDDPFGLPHTTERFVRPSKDYSWSSIVDHMGIEQAVRHPGAATTATSTYPLPRFMWVNFTLTDSAMHEGGPHSEMAAASIRDSDARLGEVLDAVEQAGHLRRHRVRARRRPRHGGERPHGAAATGTCTCARPASPSATRRYCFLYLGEH